MFVIDDLLAIFAAAAPEMFVAAEGTAAAAATAAEIAAAEAAAVTAAEVAAAEAAKIAAAEAAQAASSGIMQAAPDLMQSAANFAPETSMFGPESQQLASNANNLGQAATQVPPTPPQLTPDNYGRLGTLNTPTPPAAPSLNTSGIQQFANPSGTGPGFTPDMPANVPGATPPVVPQGYAPYDAATGSYGEVSGGTESPLMRGLNSAMNWADKNPIKSAAMGYTAYTALNKQEPYEEKPYDGPLSKYKLSPDFQGSHANPEDYRYTPRQYASGGITGYAKGGVSHPDVGIYRDSDPDTMYLDPLTAAMVRQSKLDSHSYVNTKAKFKEPTRMGTLNFKPVAGSAQGGIMQAQRYDDGGVTGSGNIDLHVPINIGSGGGGGGGGSKYDGFGGGFGGGGGDDGMMRAAVMPQAQPVRGPNGAVAQGGSALGYGGGGGGLGGLLGGLGQMFGGMMGGSRAGLGQGNQMNYGMGNDYSSMIENTNQGINPDANMKYSAFAGGGAVPGYDLGGYAAGGNPRLLRGPGDGMSDNIPATINNRQPARLADGEFVVPADVVSHLGNGSTEAGAKKLHKMMNEVRKARTGNPKQGKQINPNKYMPK
jgi:hypothetical protein